MTKVSLLNRALRDGKDPCEIVMACCDLALWQTTGDANIQYMV